ncbi:MAG: DUF5050 domain-containing protein [Massiliimalia sp.]|jgi:hypothetical protein
MTQIQKRFILVSALLTVLTFTSCQGNQPADTSSSDSSSSSVSTISQPEQPPVLEGWVTQNPIPIMNTAEDDQYIYYLNDNDNGAVYRMDKSTRTSEKIYGGQPGSLQLSPNGTLLFSQNLELHQMNTDGSSPKRLTREIETVYWGDGNSVYYPKIYDLALYRYDLNTQEVHTVLDDPITRATVTPYGIFCVTGTNPGVLSLYDSSFQNQEVIYDKGVIDCPFYANGILYFVGIEAKESDGSNNMLYAYDIRNKKLTFIDNMGSSAQNINIFVKDQKLYYFHSDRPQLLNILDLSTQKWSEMQLPASDYEMIWFTQDYLFAYNHIFNDTDSRVDILDYNGTLQEIPGHEVSEPSEPEITVDGPMDSHYTPSVLLNNGVSRNWFGIVDMTLEELNQYGVTPENVAAMLQEMKDLGYSQEDIAKIEAVIQLLEQASSGQ